MTTRRLAAASAVLTCTVRMRRIGHQMRIPQNPPASAEGRVGWAVARRVSYRLLSPTEILQVPGDEPTGRHHVLLVHQQAAQGHRLPLQRARVRLQRFQGREQRAQALRLLLLRRRGLRTGLIGRSGLLGLLSLPESVRQTAS